MAEDAKEPIEDEQSDSGSVGQEDIDALLNQAASAAAEDAPIEQTDPDAEAQSAEKAAPEPAAEAPSAPAPEPGSVPAPAAAADADAGANVSQSDIDALLQAAGSDESAPAAADPSPAAEAAAAEPAKNDEAGGLISQGALDALIAEAQSTAGEINQVTGATDAAAPASPPSGGEPLALDTLSEEASGESVATVDLLRDVSMRVKIELGRSRMYVEDVLRLGKGSVVELDKLAGDPVDVFVNDRLVAHGEVLVLNDNFCVRINEICAARGAG